MKPATVSAVSTVGHGDVRHWLYEAATVTLKRFKGKDRSKVGFEDRQPPLSCQGGGRGGTQDLHKTVQFE